MKLIAHACRLAVLGVALLSLCCFVALQAAGATVDATYNSATDVAVTASSYTAAGNTVNFTLNFAPPSGTALTVVNNTGLPFIDGTFDNLTNGQTVALSYAGTNYTFVANYYGGDGNDLVLAWAIQRPFAWGSNLYGQLGGSSTFSSMSMAGALAGKLVVALAAGAHHSLILCSDGTLAACGENGFGQLGNNSTSNSSVPVPVNTAAGVSALYGKTVVAIAAGAYHSLALCSDGSIVSWGEGGNGELGNNITTNCLVPVAVSTVPGGSALSGKKAVAIAAGEHSSLVLCSDGSVVTWGWNSYGQIGDGTVLQRNLPVLVNTAPGSALYSKTVVAIASGGWHCLALCSDGTLAAWGCNDFGQVGDNSTTHRYLPVAVNTLAGTSALAGKTVVAVAAGIEHSLALCSDGTLAAWGYDAYGQVGDNYTSGYEVLVPVGVNVEAGVSALYGKSVTHLAAGAEHSLALCSDGTVAAWGDNQSGELGNSSVQCYVPAALGSERVVSGRRFTSITSSALALHTLALEAAPPVASITLTTAPLVRGIFALRFTNAPGAFFSVLATTNASLPLTSWSCLGDARELSPGEFQFADPQAGTTGQRFFRLRSP